MQWKASADRVIIQVEQRKERVTPGGIVLTDKTRPVIERGIVIAAGPAAAGVVAGDSALFLSKAFVEVEPGIWSGMADSITALQREDD